MDVALCDWAEGLRLGPELRRRPRVEQLHLIVCIPSGEDGCAARASDAGADDVVRGPIEPAILVARVRSGLDRARLRAREALLRSLIDNVPGAVYRCRCDSDWTMEWISDQVTAICGHEPAALVGSAERSFASIIHPADRARVEDEVLAAVAADRPFSLEYRIVRPDGEERWVLERGQAQHAADGRRWLDGIIFDITERRAAEEAHRQRAIAEAQLAEVRTSRERIVAAADMARRRVERDLHDGAQQRFVSVALLLQLLRARASEHAPSLCDALDAIDHELRAGLDELRELAHGLHPAVLTHHGLGEAVRAIAARAPLVIDVRDQLGERLPEGIESAIYFVVAECLTNVAKYAEASRAWVSLRRVDGDVHVEVGDDGVGGADPAGTGLQGLCDRLAVLAGELHIDSPAGGGTIVRARVPAASLD
ncbi:MAG: PAS domain-containing protein [Solirubrobacteraceae bacterium]|nr:PAS domain-containing protein [Solirubrobacteraceae bacterium]